MKARYNFLVLVIFICAVSPVMAKNSANTDIAMKFVQRISEIQEFNEWKNATIGKILELYDLDESVNAYILELTKDGKYIGYIVVSAKRTNYPILEFSKGKSPTMIAKETGIEPDRHYYLGGTIYLFKKGAKCSDIFGKEVNLSALKAGSKDILKNEEVKRRLERRALEAETIWKAYESSANQIITYYEIMIKGVPALLWKRGCTPTASAMVLGYWDQKGYPNFPNDYQNKLIDELADAMGTWNNGYTPQWQVSGGINKVCNKYGYGNWASDVWWVTWDTVLSEINSYRPFVLTFVLHNEYTWHSVTVIGYLIDSSNNKFISLYNTWDTSVHYIAFGSWFGANAHKVIPR